VNAEQALLHLLDTQEEQDRWQDRWLLENKSANNAKIRRGLDQLDRGKGIPEDQVDSWLARMKSLPE
jgi:predicted transcriptional regulator